MNITYTGMTSSGGMMGGGSSGGMMGDRSSGGMMGGGSSGGMMVHAAIACRSQINAFTVRAKGSCL